MRSPGTPVILVEPIDDPTVLLRTDPKGPWPANEGLAHGAGGLGSPCKEGLGRVFCISQGPFELS